MIEQQCFCGEITYQVILDDREVHNCEDNWCFVSSLGLVLDPKKVLKRYVKSGGETFEHGYCGLCGCSIYKIDKSGDFKYRIGLSKSKTRSMFTGAMRYGL